MDRAFKGAQKQCLQYVPEMFIMGNRSIRELFFRSMAMIIEER